MEAPFCLHMAIHGADVANTSSQASVRSLRCRVHASGHSRILTVLAPQQPAVSQLLILAVVSRIGILRLATFFFDCACNTCYSIDSGLGGLVALEKTQVMP